MSWFLAKSTTVCPGAGGCSFRHCTRLQAVGASVWHASHWVDSCPPTPARVPQGEMAFDSFSNGAAGRVEVTPHPPLYLVPNKNNGSDRKACQKDATNTGRLASVFRLEAVDDSPSTFFQRHTYIRFLRPDCFPLSFWEHGLSVQHHELSASNLFYPLRAYHTSYSGRVT